MELNNPWVVGSSRLKSGRFPRPITWQREQNRLYSGSPAAICALSVGRGGGSGNGASVRSGGKGGGGPPSFKTMMRPSLPYLYAADSGSRGAPRMTAPPP